ncbi:RNA-binding protein 34 [Melipona quadrifasciata]|uniref:RNA-binding protein 34 n=1 Tax=Melipona quadrifasciata TaxID=166423 RepID=A0A0N0BDY1_9HYME|nr:RNA-binding protein 34 [Melipona quadrifasciata]
MVKPLLKKNKDLTSKNLNTPKHGFVQKKKNQKFKQTPTGKVLLINGSKMSNDNRMENNTPQKMDKKLQKKDIKKQEEPTKKQLKKKNSTEAEENESDLDDINEGIVLQNSTMENSDESRSSDDEGSYLEDLKKDKRTIFVNNLPKNVTKKKLEKLFKKFGKIDTIRLRGKVPKSLNISKRTAAITNDLHSKLKSIYAFVKFESEESVEKASSLNGKIFEGNYLEVRAGHKSDNDYDPKKAVFIGNLHFNIDINTIRKHFNQCGEIESVRIVQDKDSRVGKGFGYVNFKSKDAVALALELNGTTILNREVRVKPYIEQYKSKEKKHGKRVHSGEDNHSSLHKKSKNNAEVPVETEINPQEGSKFQGQKADGNQKKRKNKLEKKKKFLAEKLMAKPRKPLN